MPPSTDTPPTPAPLRILALETSGTSGSIAVFADGNLLAERQLPPGQKSAQSLAPTIVEILDQCGWRPSDVDLVAVAAGPGSFTGLRIGVTTAKTFAYATRASVSGVNTLEAIAQNIDRVPRAAGPPERDSLWTILDAQRGELFAARFVRVDSNWHIDIPTTILSADAWLARLQSGEWIAGPALAKYLSRLPEGVAAVDERFWHPTAAAVGRLAFAQYQSGRRDDHWQLVPNYYRKSAAEEKLGETDLPSLAFEGRADR